MFAAGKALLEWRGGRGRGAINYNILLGLSHVQNVRKESFSQSQFFRQCNSCNVHSKRLANVWAYRYWYGILLLDESPSKLIFPTALIVPPHPTCKSFVVRLWRCGCAKSHFNRILTSILQVNPPCRESLRVLLATGEGWHNYHHTYPWDYKAAELGNYRANFATAFIDFFALIGWAYDLKTVPASTIQRRVERLETAVMRSGAGEIRICLKRHWRSDDWEYE